jgi:hypothetical protein
MNQMISLLARECNQQHDKMQGKLRSNVTNKGITTITTDFRCIYHLNVTIAILHSLFLTSFKKDGKVYT